MNIFHDKEVILQTSYKFIFLEKKYTRLFSIGRKFGIYGYLLNMMGMHIIVIDENWVGIEQCTFAFEYQYIQYVIQKYDYLSVCR